jgi:hypothetical protein
MPAAYRVFQGSIIFQCIIKKEQMTREKLNPGDPSARQVSGLFIS